MDLDNAAALLDVMESSGTSVSATKSYACAKRKAQAYLRKGFALGGKIAVTREDGAWCLFRLSPEGTRQGKIVLVQHKDIHDADTGGHFTVKKYSSKKEYFPDGTWKHTQIVLKPETTALGYEPIVLNPAAEEDLRVIAEFITVLG